MLIMAIVWPDSFEDHLGVSWALYLGAALSGVLAMTSYSTLFPFTVYSKKIYTVALSCGMGSSSLLASIIAIIQGCDDQGNPLRFTERVYFLIILIITLCCFISYIFLFKYRQQHLDYCTLSQSRPEILIREGIIGRIEDYFSFFEKFRRSSVVSYPESDDESSEEGQAVTRPLLPQSIHSESSNMLNEEIQIVPPHLHLLAREGTWKEDFKAGKSEFITIFSSSLLFFMVIGVLPFLIEHEGKIVERVKYLFWIDCVAFFGTFLGRCCIIRTNINISTVTLSSFLDIAGNFYSIYLSCWNFNRP